MRLAIILVHYHTPELAAAAVAALRRDLGEHAEEDAEWLLIDNGSEAAGRELLERLPVRRVDPGTNLGYAGGVNLGVARSTAEAIVLMNPDVLVLPGCVAALVTALRQGAAVAGPRFWWDAGRRLMLPPAEPRSRRDELAALLAGRSGRAARWARRRWRRHARRHWNAGQPLASYALSGSLLAVRRSAWERIGPFDEGFRLFFEETDWLRRLERANLPARYVPGAEAVHLHGQSAVREPLSQQWFEESARRFRVRHYGSWFAALLTAAARQLPPEGPHLPELPASGLDLTGFSYPLWIEVSPNAIGFPAAVERLTAPPAGGWRLPEEVAERLPPGDLALQVVDEAGRELLRGVLPHRPVRKA